MEARAHARLPHFMPSLSPWLRSILADAIARPRHEKSLLSVLSAPRPLRVPTFPRGRAAMPLPPQEATGCALLAAGHHMARSMRRFQGACNSPRGGLCYRPSALLSAGLLN